MSCIISHAIYYFYKMTALTNLQDWWCSFNIINSFTLQWSQWCTGSNHTLSKFCITFKKKLVFKKWIHFLDIWNSRSIHYPWVACRLFESMMRCFCMPFHLCMSVCVFLSTHLCNCCLLELQFCYELSAKQI